MQSTFLRWILLILLVSGASTILAQDDDSSEPLVGQAFINTVEIENTDDGIQLLITGDFPDTCTELGEISQSVEDDTITVIVETLTPADVVCAQALTPFETSYELDVSELEEGSYTIDVNGVTETLDIGEDEPLTCPEADEETALFDDDGICFLYPVDFDVLAGRDFIFISQPRTANAILLISFEDADGMSFDDSQADMDDNLSFETSELGGADALIIETDSSYEAIVIANDVIYQINVQPIAEDNFSEELWALLTETIYFPDPESETDSE